MTDWSLPQLLAGLHDDIERRLATARKAFVHPGTKGDASESIWLQLFQTYLPQRYRAASAHVVDSKGTFSDQIDVVLFDRQYSPFIFHYEGQTIVPAESVYAVFEAKQTINAGQIDYAQQKVASVRRLYRTSLPIPHAGGTYRHGINRNVLYTDGAQHVAEHGGAYWLLDEIAIIQPYNQHVAAEEFQVWKLAVHPDRTATLTCDDGNGNIVFTKKIEHTDFPLDEITLYFTNDVIHLPSEY